MKLSENYMLSEIDGQHVAIPIGQNVADMKKIISLNKTAHYICELLTSEMTVEEIIERMCEEYECKGDEEKAMIRHDVLAFTSAATCIGLIVE